jgi:hypothetical protein
MLDMSQASGPRFLAIQRIFIMVAAFFTHYGVVSNQPAMVVNIVQGLLQRRLLRWLRLDHYNYVDLVAIALLAFRRSSLPLAHPKHERVPPELLSARPINPGSVVCMKQGRHGGRAQHGRVSFWTRVREERTTTAS